MIDNIKLVFTNKEPIENWLLENSEKFKLTIPENVKNEIGYWLTDMQGEIRTEEEKNLFKEIREKLNLKKVYGD